MKIAAIILAYWDKRMPHIPVIINDLKKQTRKPDIIVVINNNPDYSLNYPGIVTINCSENLGVSIRSGIASSLDCTHIFTLDDDASVEPKVLENLIKFHEKEPESIVGYYGMRLKDNDKTNRYWNGQRLRSDKITEISLTDTVGSRITFFKKSKLTNALKVMGDIPNYPHNNCEDILISYVNKKEGFQNYVIPEKEGSKWIDLGEEGCGLSWAKEQFKAERLLALDLIDNYYGTRKSV